MRPAPLRLLVTFQLILFLVLALSLSFTDNLVAASQERAPVIEGPWRFLRGDAAPDAIATGWQEIQVPHTWNADDGADGGGNYYRGPGWYVKQLEVPAGAGAKRVFIRFEAASIVSDVYLNGRHLGQHRGGFGAFCYELTPYLRHDGVIDELRVRVDNTRVEDVAPLAGDFTVCGGIYRPVHLLVLPRTCISPLDEGSPGIYLSAHDVSAERAMVRVRTVLTTTENSEVAAEARIVVRDATGARVAEQTMPVGVRADSPAEARAELTMDKPHLWNGRTDPYLYTVQVDLAEAGGKILDTVIQPLGLRTAAIDPTRGFVLNGQAGKIRGVDRHQDFAGKGWAISNADRDQDMALIKEMGVTGIRLAHYPHDSYFYDLCDREGMIVWAEIPLVNHIKSTPAFRENIKGQLRELIRQQGNHPCICMWSLFNELYVPPTDIDPTLIKELQTLAHAEDPTRGTVFAGHGDNPLKQPDLGTPEDLRNITDYIATNRYPGWYYGTPDQMADEINVWNVSGHSRGLGISEYGAGASVRQHEPWPPKKPATPTGPWHPEEYQALVHEECYRAIAGSPVTWGSFVWAMFDFASDSRKEGDQPGINDKGLVTRDRKVRKDAFYFYKANWNPEPMVHLVGTRYTDRKAGTTALRVYSNCEQVELFLNGRSLGSKQPDEYKRLLWEEVPLGAGANHVELVGSHGSGKVLEGCDWRVGP